MRNAMNGRAARTGSASEKFGRKVRAWNARSTFDKPLACVTGIYDHAFGKPLTWITDKFTYTFDPLLTASRRSQVSKNGLYRLWTGWQRRFQKWSLMRVKSHQIRAKVAFTKPLTTHLVHGKGDFSCREGAKPCRACGSTLWTNVWTRTHIQPRDGSQCRASWGSEPYPATVATKEIRESHPTSWEIQWLCHHLMVFVVSKWHWLWSYCSYSFFYLPDRTLLTLLKLFVEIALFTVPGAILD